MNTTKIYSSRYYIYKLITLVLVFTLAISCEKDETLAPLAPSITKIEAPENLSTVIVGSKIELKAITNQEENEGRLKETKYEWKINNIYSPNNMPNITIEITKVGEYNITLKVINQSGVDSVNLKYFAIDPPKEGSSKWISQIIEFRPAPGQYTNKLLGNLDGAQTIVGKKGMVSLGGYGGYIIFKFDHTVINEEGDDFVIHGNAFKGSSEPGIVMVAYDSNGNGKPDPQEWYELKGSEHNNPETNLNYILTYYKPSQTETAEDIKWTDNTGATGFLNANNFHRQCYYPLFFAEGVPETIEYTGTLLPPTAIQDPETGYWKVNELEWGYVDNYSDKYGVMIGDDRDTQRSNKFDISNAIDKTGNPVELKAIDFIKVYTGVNQQAGWLGETSTEVCGAISLRANHSN